MKSRVRIGRALIVAVILASAAAPARAAQAPAAPVPPSKSAAHAKEVVSLLTSKKLEAFALRDPTDPKKFIALLHIPNVQLLVISASHEHASDLDYGFYQKDYMGLYQDLNSSPMSKGKVFIEDAVCDGLVAVPAKGGGRDSITIGTDRRTFDGDFLDPRKKDPKKISQDDYMKAFAAADEQYDHMLVLILDELKKPGL